MRPHHRANVLGGTQHTAEIVAGFLTGLRPDPAFSRHHNDAAQIAPARSFIEPLEIAQVRNRPTLSRLNATMAFLDATVVVMRHTSKGTRLRLGKELDHLLMYTALVAFQPQHILRALLPDLAGDGPLAAHSVDRHHTPVEG